MTLPSPGSDPEDRKLAAALSALRARTPARLLAGRAGPSYRTSTQLELREDHAIAVDAVQTELNLARDFDADFIQQRGLFTVTTQARDKAEYLKQPGRGRLLSESARQLLIERCPRAAEVQIAIGDGLSAAAVVTQVPRLLPLLERGALDRGWTLGQSFIIQHCRVGVLNEIGAVLAPQVVILLIGERPGLATAESLSAYLAYHPQPGHTDAERNLISNIHARGVPPQQAAERILDLAAQMKAAQTSGIAIKEQLPQNNQLNAPGRLPER